MFFKVTTFLSAFLLFQLELIVAKKMLPIYGGSYQVWGACIVFFQAVLLLGYVFAQTLIDRLGMKKYRWIHLALFVAPFAFFPGKPLAFSQTLSEWPMVIDIFVRLLVTIGPVFFVLSTVSLVTQSWLVDSSSGETKNDEAYPLFAASNFGSLLALITYPFIFEYIFGLHVQEQIWTYTYGFVCILFFIMLFVIPVFERKEKVQEEVSETIDWKRVVEWFGLGAAGVIMFLSVSNIITYEMTPIPLLWIIPLGIYLLSYMLNFKERPWCPSWITNNVHLALGFSALFYFFLIRRGLPIVLQLAALCFLLFMLCMYCQRELYRRRPESKNALLLFYVWMAFGGFIGGLFTTWIMPLVSISLGEYFLGLFIIAIMTTKREGSDQLKDLNVPMILYFVLVMYLYPAIFCNSNVVGIIIMVIALKIIFDFFWKTKYSLMLAYLILFMLCAPLELFWLDSKVNHRKRNYYGIYEVLFRDDVKMLNHGSTLHGTQYTYGPINEPLAYYSFHSPGYKLLKSDLFDIKKVAGIGLGTGTIAMALGKGQQLDFFELDPDVHQITNKYFTYIQMSEADVTVQYGDARISMLDEKPNQYDVILIDAFGGDSIPTHLVTKEAFELYRSLLTENGLILIHITNRYVDVGPAVHKTIEGLGANSYYLSQGTKSPVHLKSTWQVVTWNKDHHPKLTEGLDWVDLSYLKEDNTRPWTDDYSNILQTIRLGAIGKSLLNFSAFK